jgi:hypothetical protein
MDAPDAHRFPFGVFRGKEGQNRNGISSTLTLPCMGEH